MVLFIVDDGSVIKDVDDIFGCIIAWWLMVHGCHQGSIYFFPAELYDYSFAKADTVFIITLYPVGKASRDGQGQ
jgi:hypothetical protein